MANERKEIAADTAPKWIPKDGDPYKVICHDWRAAMKVQNFIRMNGGVTQKIAMQDFLITDYIFKNLDVMEFISTTKQCTKEEADAFKKLYEV